MASSSHEPIDLGLSTVTFLIEASDSDGALTVCRCDLTEGAGMPVPHSQDGFEETIFGLEGTSTVIVEGKDISLGPGDAVCIKRGEVHSFKADQGDASVLLTSTPGVFGPEYFQELAAVLNPGPPDPVKIADIMARHGLVPGRFS